MNYPAPLVSCDITVFEFFLNVTPNPIELVYLEGGRWVLCLL